MSSFTVSGHTACTFTASQDGFTERWQNHLRTWNFELFLASASDYTTLIALYSEPVVIRLCPGTAGATPYADIGGGVGSGALVLDNVVGSPFTAALTGMDRPSAYPGGGCRVRATFQEVP